VLHELPAAVWADKCEEQNMQAAELSIAEVTDFFHAYNAEFRQLESESVNAIWPIPRDTETDEIESPWSPARALIFAAWLGPPLIAGAALGTGLAWIVLQAWNMVAS
jgi:hypothetical protein